MATKLRRPETEKLSLLSRVFFLRKKNKNIGNMFNPDQSSTL